MKVYATDPGITGCVAAVGSDGSIRLFDIPTSKTDNFNGIVPLAFRDDLRKLIGGDRNVTVYCEKSILSPGNGKQALRSVYDCRGVIRAVLALEGHGLEYVSSPKWKKHFGLIDADKERSRGLAIQLYPQHADLFKRKKDHNRAEAVLIARYILETKYKGD